MSDKMCPLSFSSTLNWIYGELKKDNSIFGIHRDSFVLRNLDSSLELFDHKLGIPIGPAAGPHTQLTQNLVSAYLTGGRFFELKTVQIMDELEISKPCIDAQDECYNIEWSQELKVDQSIDEYIKAWLIIHFLNSLFNSNRELQIIFNMNVGYDLKGIQSEKINYFIETLKDASKYPSFLKWKEELISFSKIIFHDDKFLANNNVKSTNEELVSAVDCVSPRISNSMTLSTMHGCPPDEIEAIANYLLTEKKIHTFIKLNPTLLGYEFVKSTLKNLGYNYLTLSESSFERDLNLNDAKRIVANLKSKAEEQNLTFGVKLSNTLPVQNYKNYLKDKEMYLSGRALYPLTINLAKLITETFGCDISISYSGGANLLNTIDILSTGIAPITYATDLLKPGGYLRLKSIAEKILSLQIEPQSNLNIESISKLAENSLTESVYQKHSRKANSIKLNKPLPVTDCFIAPCVEACPINQDVPEYISLISQNRFEDAFNLITSKNSLPHITGYICDHQCMFHCTRIDYDKSVEIRELKKQAALNGYNELANDINSNSISVAIIGAGPSGLSAAYFLAKSGFDVTVFEHEMNAGGIVKNVIPHFRLPESAIEKDIQFIERIGVRFVFGADYNFSIERLKAEGYKYIYLAIGAAKSQTSGITSIDSEILHAVSFLWEYRKNGDYRLGEKVAVIGGGNSAMDSARAALRCSGVKEVNIVYRRTVEQMPADKEEYEAAIDDGVLFKELLQPIDFSDGKLKCRKMQLGEIQKDGRRGVTPVENKFEHLEMNSIISAIGEIVDAEILSKNKLTFNGEKSAATATNLENVFIGGDARRGAATVVEAIADGRNAADQIMLKENLSSKEYSPSNLSTERKIGKGIVDFNYGKDITTEAQRCLMCNYECNKCVDVCPNRANIVIKTSGGGLFKDKNQILHIDSFCNECGNCETFCPYAGAPYKEKFTFFRNEVEMQESANPGFCVIDTEIKIRKVRGSEIEIYSESDSKVDLLIKELMTNYRYILAN
ncbi:MAG: putative selenate reductase subunit YgfK [Bacteroidota bacterium]